MEKKTETEVCRETAGDSLSKSTTELSALDRLAETASWYLQLRRDTNDAFWPLYRDTHRYLVLKGGGGSGKSIFAGRKILERAICEPRHRFLVCRKVARTLRESCFRQLCGQLEQHYPASGCKINRSDMVLQFQNGSEILFAGLDDVEKLKSIYNITGIWIEEASELLEGDFNQLDIRLRGKTAYYKQIILTFNPISISHWLKRRFFDNRDPRAVVHESTYRDNRFLDDEAKRTLESFREEDEYYYQVYCLGMWGVTGKSVFCAKAITARLAEHILPQNIGMFTYTDDRQRLDDIVWQEDADGYIKIYRQPEEGVPYVIGGDTAGEGSDAFVAQVIDNRDGKQVAVLRHTFDEDLYARQVYCLGRYYNDALIGIETNYSTYPVRELERLGYPKQYVRENMDDYTHTMRTSYGFRTDAKTRPVMLSGLIRAVRDDVTILFDRVTMEEMLTFVRSESYRPEAEAGAHDDCVMALAIAHAIRWQQRYEIQKVVSKTQWSDSMREDYENASSAEREMLLRKWGAPR